MSVLLCMGFAEIVAPDPGIAVFRRSPGGPISLRAPHTPSAVSPGLLAYEIITSILEDPSPDLDLVKGRLRRCVAAHPGSPERALQAHLMATSEVGNAYGRKRPA